MINNKKYYRRAIRILRPRRLAAVLALFSLSLAGCSSVPSAPQNVDPGASFLSTGKMSLRPQSDSPNSDSIQGFTANYRWQQTGAEFDIELWGALGQGRTRITGTANKIKIVDGSGRTVKSRRPERLLKRHLGWSLPLGVLPYWLQGKAAPNPPASLMRFQANGDLETMQQLGWTLEFDRYQSVRGVERMRRLPGRIKARSSELRLTIVSREWLIPAASLPASE